MNRFVQSRFIPVLLAIVVLTALIIRIAPVILNPEPDRNGLGPFGDSFLYHVIAFNVYKGNGFSGTFTDLTFGFRGTGVAEKYEPQVTRGPVYPLFLSIVYELLGSAKGRESAEVWRLNWDKVRIVQGVMDASVCILVFCIARLMVPGSFFPALLSALLYCFCFYNIYYSRALMSESLMTFLLTAALLFSILGMKTGKMLWWTLSGGLFGLAILIKPEFMLFPAVLVLFWMMVVKRRTMEPLVLLMTAALVILPWTVRNFMVFKQVIPVSVGGIGMSLFLGTCENKNAWKGWRDIPDGAFDSPLEHHRAQTVYAANLEERRTGSIMAHASDQELKSFAMARIRQHPWECIKNWILKLPRLWYQNYIPMYRDKEASGHWLIFYLMFATVALWRGTRQERLLAAPVVLLFMYLNVIFLPLHVEPRYSVALLPGIICMASIGLWKIVSMSGLLCQSHSKLKFKKMMEGWGCSN